MPRQPSYTPDDEDDDLRRAGATGGGVPAWVWVVGGSGVLAVLLCGGLGVALFIGRQAAVRQEVVRAEMVQADIAMKADMPMKQMRAGPGAGVAGEVPVSSLAEIATAYRDDTAAADARFKGQVVRVEIEVWKSGEGWVGTFAAIGRGLPRDRTPNVYFRVPGVRVADGVRVVIEGTCAGLSADPQTGSRLTFTDCRLVEE
jgi:hypothetical protein